MGAPDQLLLRRMRTALDRWEAAGGGPTSSLSGGGAIAELEARMAERCGVAHALAVASGTIALRAAIGAVGVEAGSEVIVPALDWPAAAAAVLSLGATPVPADCRLDSILVDPEAIRCRVGGRTRAIVVTHLAGMPVDMTRMLQVANAFGIPVVEDCSQALGAVDRGRPVGSIGTVGVFSLGPGKIVDAGEGGVLVSDDPLVYERALRATQHPARLLRAGFAPHTDLALAARVHPAAAFLALPGLDGLDAELARRKTVADEIRERAGGCGVRVADEEPHQRFSWPVVAATVGPEASARLRHRGLGTTAIGLSHIPSLVGDDRRVPNAARVGPRAHRLYLRADR
jgi:dTDP-4-amino-4,6-dideoxygalactose transaminase